MITKDDIKRWFEHGLEYGHDFMIIVCDTFDYEDYPVYASKDTFHDKYREYDGVNMQRIMEVYDLRRDVESQVSIKRSLMFP